MVEITIIKLIPKITVHAPGGRIVYSLGMVVLDLISRQQPNCESNAIFPNKIASTKCLAAFQPFTQFQCSFSSLVAHFWSETLFQFQYSSSAGEPTTKRIWLIMAERT